MCMATTQMYRIREYYRAHTVLRNLLSFAKTN